MTTDKLTDAEKDALIDAVVNAYRPERLRESDRAIFDAAYALGQKDGEKREREWEKWAREYAIPALEAVAAIRRAAEAL